MGARSPPHVRHPRASGAVLKQPLTYPTMATAERPESGDSLRMPRTLRRPPSANLRRSSIVSACLIAARDPTLLHPLNGGLAGPGFQRAFASRFRALRTGDQKDPCSGYAIARRTEERDGSALG